MTKLLLSLFAAVSLLQADFTPKDWQYRRVINLSAPVELSQILLDSSVYARSRAQLHDLRIVRDGSEIAYELQVSSGNIEERRLPLEIVNKAIVPGHGLQATLDLKGHPQHNRLRIATAQKNFKETMLIETSDDARHWSLVRAEALIFDISRLDRTVSDLTAEYPVSTRRYVRLTIPGWRDPAFLESAWLLQVSETKPIRDQVASLKPAVSQDATARTTSYTFDIGFPGQPFDEVQLSTGPDLFFRNVDVFTSNNSRDWTLASSSVISNRPDDVHLQLQIPEQWDRYFKLVIGNGDSPPITLTSVILRAVQRTLRFSTLRSGRYRLYSGDAAAQPPRYDLTQIVASKATALPVTLGKPEINAEFQTEPVPWSDRNPHLLTGLVIAAAVLMIAITLRLLTRVPTGTR